MKRISLKVMVVGLLCTTFALAAVTAATPKWIGDRIVDKIMEWGDKNVKGPFKKGGGDEAATRAVVSALVSPGNPLVTAFNLTFRNIPSTATPDQDSPGYSQQNGVPMPAGSRASSQPTNSQSHDSGVGSQHDPTGRTGMVSGGIASGSSGNSSAAAQNDAGAGASQPHSNQTWLRAGENSVVQANKETAFNPNPEAATGGNPAPSNPAPAAQSAPSPAPTPAPTQHDHVQGAFGHDGGGGHQGNYGGPDAHSSQVDHAGHIT
jgi:hypothetical protein